jgi:hypothetical protein
MKNEITNEEDRIQDVMNECLQHNWIANIRYLTLNPTQEYDGSDFFEISKLVIICKKAERDSIKAVLRNIGFQRRIRGFITEMDLIKSYKLACGEKYVKTVGKGLMIALYRSFMYEFPLNRKKIIEKFSHDRGYDFGKLKDLWSLTIS